MRAVSCVEEAAVTRAVLAGALSVSLAEHAAACETCGSIVQSAAWMRGLAAEGEGRGALPDAGLVYWRAQLSERAAQAEKIYDVLDWAEVIFAIGAIGAVGWLVWPGLAMMQATGWSAAGWEVWLASSAGMAAVATAGCLGLLAAVGVYVDFAGE